MLRISSKNSEQIPKIDLLHKIKEFQQNLIDSLEKPGKWSNTYSLPIMLIVGPGVKTAQASSTILFQLYNAAKQFHCKPICFDYRGIANESSIQKMNEIFFHIASLLSPSLILINKGEMIYPLTLQAIREKIPTKIVVWYHDQFCQLEKWFAGISAKSDFAFMTSNWDYQFNEYRNAGVKNIGFLPVGADIEYFQPINLSHEEKNKYSTEVSFIGRYWEWGTEREAILKKLVQSNIELSIWSPNEWPELISYRKRGVFGEEFLKAHAGAKIVLNINSQTSSIMHYMSDRYFFSMACGAFTLVKYIPGIEDFFQNHVHLVWFHNGKQAIQLVKYYLNKPEERMQIGKNARREIIKNHTFLHRIKTIIQKNDLGEIIKPKHKANVEYAE